MGYWTASGDDLDVVIIHVVIPVSVLISSVSAYVPCSGWGRAKSVWAGSWLPLVLAAGTVKTSECCDEVYGHRTGTTGGGGLAIKMR